MWRFFPLALLIISSSACAMELDHQNYEIRAKLCSGDNWQLNDSPCHEFEKQTYECLELGSKASEIWAMKGVGYKADSSWAISQAYGPNGQVFRGSEDAERILSELVDDAFSGDKAYGTDAGSFSSYAYNACVRGEL